MPFSPRSVNTRPDTAAVRRLVGQGMVLWVGTNHPVSEWLEEWFERVVFTDSATEAVGWLNDESLALAVSDAGTDEGMRFVHRVRNSQPQLTVVALAPSDVSTVFELVELDAMIVPADAAEIEVYARVRSALETAHDRKINADLLAKLANEVQFRTAELREAQGQIVRLQEAKDNMLALISHEIRTPLNGILGFLDLLHSPDFAADAPAFLTHVEDSAKRLERSSRKALDFASLSTGMRAAKPRPHRISDLLEAAREQLDHRGQGLPVVWFGDETLETDGELVVQILGNLLENTAKYGGPTPTAALNLTREPRWDVLRYSDDGPGFPEAALLHLFQPFSTGGILHHAEGMGLGMALIDVIMLTLGGRAEAGNAPEGGAFVTLRFPVSAKQT